MERIVYFGDKALLFGAAAPSPMWFEVRASSPGAAARAKVLKILETHNRVALVGADPEALFARFAADFAYVEAAGGVVTDEAGRHLLIYRNGRWDLPKGHVEAGESDAACAEREIAEETGVAAAVEAPLCETLHAYRFTPTRRWELKRTRWFRLRPQGESELRPQGEEGIEQVAWCDAAQLSRSLESSYPTIRAVFDALKSGR